MKWRELKKGDLIHLIETMHSDDEIMTNMRATRKLHAEMREKSQCNREVCWSCQRIAQHLGIE